MSGALNEVSVVRIPIGEEAITRATVWINFVAIVIYFIMRKQVLPFRIRHFHDGYGNIRPLARAESLPLHFLGLLNLVPIEVFVVLGSPVSD